MPRPGFILAVLFALVLALAGSLLPAQLAFEERSTHSGGVLATLLGDGRRMFANHYFKKADAYFHRGRYPSIFDQVPAGEENHMAEGAHDQDGDSHANVKHEHETETAITQGAEDWIARFGQHFRPNAHVHLESGEEQEVLPWLRFSVELDPHNVDAFVFTAYWLRTRLGKVEEAEQFLREGLRANPGSYEIYYELGQLYLRARANGRRAGTLFEIALRQWDRLESGKDKETRDDVSLRQILGGLVRADESLGDYDGAIAAMQRLKTVSPQPESVQKQIDELHARQKVGAGAVSPR